MLSRIADALYWMARYLERVDATARLIEVDLLQLLEAEAEVTAETHWRPLLGLGGRAEAYAALHADGLVTQERVIRFLTVERTNPNAIRACLRLARDNAGAARDRIAGDAWEIVNALWVGAASELDRADGPDAMIARCRAIRGDVARLRGVTASTMLRDEAFAFQQLGTFVERADMTARILDVKYHLRPQALALGTAALDYYQWAALLQSLAGFEAYRRRDRVGFDPQGIVALVVLEPGFPHALRFALDRIGEALAAIAGDASAPARALRALQGALVEARAGDALGAALHGFLLQFVAGVGALDATLRGTHFHTAPEAACGT
jgi:uncharacterized alpha-E superfamily protein